MLDTVNWLTITTPFIAGFSAYNWGQKAGEGKLIPTIVGLLAFLGLIGVWYVMYQFINFPFWMVWFQ